MLGTHPRAFKRSWVWGGTYLGAHLPHCKKIVVFWELPGALPGKKGVKIFSVCAFFVFFSHTSIHHNFCHFVLA